MNPDNLNILLNALNDYGWVSELLPREAGNH